jgi:beta-glucosidase
MLDLTKSFKDSTPGEWRTMSIPLSCLANQAADLREVAIPLAIETDGRFAISISNVQLTNKGSTPVLECNRATTR